MENQRVEDITFHGGRMQSEIIKELGLDKTIPEKDVSAPTSITSEQLKAYCMKVISSTSDQNKRRTYGALVRTIEERDELKASLRRYTLQELRNSALDSDTPDDLQSDTQDGGSK